MNNALQSVHTYLPVLLLIGGSVMNIRQILTTCSAFDDVRFHDLRHSCGLYARDNGASMKELQLMLGHSKISTSMDIYGYKSDLLERETAQKMDAFIRSKWHKRSYFTPPTV